ncbi:hypothetical protein SFHH103_psfHH103d_72 (plasmid) [Sinorhizobium fredii HH103]|nr:hypothetical protein SFHH103_04775 [Sinorhizobium fredii HH103]CEO91269.1 hypothetical protein SFHH103_psfHH103d_72 [Sinorhizobium fredii HH103]
MSSSRVNNSLSKAFFSGSFSFEISSLNFSMFALAIKTLNILFTCVVKLDRSVLSGGIANPAASWVGRWRMFERVSSLGFWARRFSAGLPDLCHVVSLQLGCRRSKLPLVLMECGRYRTTERIREGRLHPCSQTDTHRR